MGFERICLARRNEAQNSLAHKSLTGNLNRGDAVQDAAAAAKQPQQLHPRLAESSHLAELVLHCETPNPGCQAPLRSGPAVALHTASRVLFMSLPLIHAASLLLCMSLISTPQLISPGAKSVLFSLIIQNTF